MTEDELELFIAEQKARIAKERQQLELNKSLDKSHDMRRDILGVSGSNEIIQTARPNKEAAQSNKQDDGRALPRGSYTNLREKLNAERREEYKRFLEEKKMRSGPENGRNQKESPNENATNSLGIGERNSAKLNARRQRNQEYNEYLKQKGKKHNGQSVSDEQKIRNMNGVDRQSPKVQKDHSPRDVNGYSENTSRSPRPRHAEHYYDTSRPKRSHHYDNKESRSPLPRYDDHSPPRRYYDDVPPPPRRGWGTPVHLDYDDILRRKRQEEARYRRYDDDMDYYRERGIQPSISDPYLNRPGPSRRRYYDRYEDERDNDDRRVRFEEYSGRGRYSKGDDSYDDIDNKNFREERSRTMPEMDRPVQNNQPEPVNTRKPRPKSAEDEGFFIGQRQSQSASQRKKEEYRKELEKQMEEAKETKRRNRNIEREEGLKVNATGLQDPEKLPDRLKGLSKHGSSRQAPSHGYNTTTQNTKYQPSFAPQMNQPYVPPPAQDLGLEAAFFKSKAPMLEKPFELERYQYKSDSVDPYSYYGHRNPMEGEPVVSRPGDSPQGLPSGMNPYYNGYNDGYVGVSPYGRGQDNPPQNGNSMSQGSTLNPRPTQPIQKNGRSSIQGFVGDDSKTPQKKGGSRSYQDELLLQIQEKERRKREEKAAQERYDQKMEAEAKLYEPFGKGGGGAPMRDNKGHIIADLKQVKQMQTTEDVFGGSTIQGNPMISPRGQVQIPVHHTLPESVTVGGDTTPVNAQDEYKESLRLQIEEKKRRQAEEKERERLREEKQERDLQEQRDKMQREFEAEKEKQRLKEEKTRQQNEEMAKLAEEKRKQAEMKQAVMEEKSVKQHSRITEVHKEAEVLQRVESPPIPTLRKTEPRVESPPIPTLRKAEPSRTESPPVPALRKQEQTKIPSPRNNSPIVPTLEQMQGDSMTNGRRSPPVPAVTTKERAGDKERNVMSALSTMRKQLQSEQRRVQQALEREYDPYTHVPSSHGSRRASPQVNVLDLDKKKKKPKPVTVRRELTNHAAAQEFNHLKDRGSQSRQKMREQYPDKPTTDIALEAQQRALLRQQEEKLDNMRKAYRPSAYDTTINLHNIGRRNESPLIALESSSAFIGIDSGESKIPPDERSLPGSARTRDLYGDIGSINEDVLEVMERKNKERIAALAAIESDMSNEDPDDVLQKFMSKGSSDRPPTGKSEDLSLWLQPSGY